ncbi:hypothetical protein RB195_006430 [Necator americanus]|uniref:Uncharacterized protein n=1 Tax=Necator americanus TaxID=51031 RepID=A0ABR1BSK2_NECAM
MCHLRARATGAAGYTKSTPSEFFPSDECGLYLANPVLVHYPAALRSTYFERLCGRLKMWRIGMNCIAAVIELRPSSPSIFSANRAGLLELQRCLELNYPTSAPALSAAACATAPHRFDSTILKIR